MGCDAETNLFTGELLVDSFGGSVKLLQVASNLGSILVTINTPWGDEDSYVEINKGATKTYVKGEKTYTVRCDNIGDIGGGVGRVQVCYEFVEKLNTTLAMNYDESSNLVEGGTVKFDLVLKDQNGVALLYNVDIHVNGVFERYVSGDASYSHLITADELGSALTFQAKFKGLGVYNPSQSSVRSVNIPGKAGTSLNMSADKNTVAVGRTVVFTGVLKDDKGVEIANQTVYLVYKSGGYGYVLDKDGFKIVASTDLNGKYYRPWEPLEKFLDFNTYGMYFAGNDNYEPTYSPDLLLNVIPDTCTQNIQILDVKYNPVPGVTVKMNDVSKVTDAGGNVSFPNIQRDQAYTVYKTLDTYSGSDENVIGCKFDPQILHVIVPHVCPVPILTGIEVT